MNAALVRNFQVFGALDFLAELTQHIPEKSEHLIRYYGWYSHRRRGMRANSGSGSFSGRQQADTFPSSNDGKKSCLTLSAATNQPRIDHSAARRAKTDAAHAAAGLGP